MKTCFIKKSKSGLKALFDMFVTLVVMGWPIVVGFYIILFILNPIQNPTTFNQALDRMNWNMSTGTIYALIVGIIAIIYNFAIGIPLVACYILGED